MRSEWLTWNDQQNNRLLWHSSKLNRLQRNRLRHRSQHHNRKIRKEATMTCHSNLSQYFPESKPTGWTRGQFPNQNNRLPNKVWRKQQK